MKNFELKIFITILLCAAISMCTRNNSEGDTQEEIATAKPISKNCKYVCDVTQTPNLRLITAASQNPPATNGVIDTNSYFWRRYGIRVFPIEFTPNYVVTANFGRYYGWDSGAVYHLVRLQCVNENIAPVGCQNNWQFDTSQGRLVNNEYLYDGLFEFKTYELGFNGNWGKPVYVDVKKNYNPSVVPAKPYTYDDICYVPDRCIPAQSEDSYRNFFRLPPHDGTYKIEIQFNPLNKNCHVVIETNYNDDGEVVTFQVLNGQLINLTKFIQY